MENVVTARILLVQNVQTQSNSTRTYLESLGYEIIWAGSGLTALIAAKNSAVDIILLDVALPDMEGLDLCRMFRKLYTSRAIPIILLVGRGYSPEAFVSPEYRPDSYIEKPYTEDDLNSKIFELLKRRTTRTPDTPQVSPPAECPRTHTEQRPAVVSAPEPKPVQRPVLKLVPKSSIESPSAPLVEERGAYNVIDPATGLFSKQQFEAMFSKSFKQCQRFKQQMSCMLIDLDGTKMGRTADQELIKAIVALVQTTIREVDTAAWWTGESLIVLLPNTLRNDAVQAAARVLEAVANHSFSWPDATRVTMSIGVAGLPDSSIDSEQKLIDAAALASRNALDMMAPVPKSLDEFIRNRNNPIKANAVGEKKSR
jgi:diguanylate cyclase (GGDEF)-like protein